MNKNNGKRWQLFEAIRVHQTYHHEVWMKKDQVVSLVWQLKICYRYCQSENQDIHKYYKTCQLMVISIESFGCKIGSLPIFLASYYKSDNLTTKDVDLMTSTVHEIFVKNSKEYSLAVMFVMSARQDVYGQLLTDLENRFLLGHDDFLKTLTEV